MLNKDYLKIFSKNQDAVASNRGYYYQYLITLKKWVDNFISEKSESIFSEVEQDIKQVGDELIFTQVKSYSSSFSFKSKEIQKTIFDFFLLFLKYHNETALTFSFTTNTHINSKESLLIRWIENATSINDDLKKQIIKKIEELLITELNLRKRKELQILGKNDIKSKEVKEAVENLKLRISINIEDFINAIKWHFSNQNPEDSIKSIFNDIGILLIHEKFEGRPVSILQNALLSEIYRCSQLKNKDERVLSNSTIRQLLKTTDTELQEYFDNKFLRLINSQYEELKIKIDDLQKNSIQHTKRLDVVEQWQKTNQNSINPPHELTLLPFVNDEDIYGREDLFKSLKDTLIIKKNISISGYGGFGKSFFIQKFISKYGNEFDHIIWVSCSPSLINNIAFNEVLIRNLNISFSEKDLLEKRFQIICSEIQKLNGKNIFIIDNFENEKEVLQQILALNNWSVIITTRSKIDTVYQLSIPQLDFESAKSIYKNNSNSKIETDEALLLNFFNHIEFNPLVIKLTAKTISNSIDLNLNTFYDYVVSENLDNASLDIDISISEEFSSIRIYSYLQKKFELRNLTKEEENYLDFLSLLPSDDIIIDELAQIGGPESYPENKNYFLNVSNSLHEKGWIERKEGRIKMYKLIQDIVRYNQRKGNPFVSCSFLIMWLYRRIDENAPTNPNKSFKYLKYAESILNSIKEPYRFSIYQPLLLLENALLHAYGWQKKHEEIHDRWKDFIERAENYLPKDDKNLGIMFNNMAMSYVNIYDYKNALPFFNKSVDVLEKNVPKTNEMLLNSLNNLLTLYVVTEDFLNALVIIKKATDLIKKISSKNYQYIAMLSNIFGFTYQKLNDLNKAIYHYNLAAELHLKIEKEARNDYNLANYYINICVCYFKLSQHDNVLPILEKATLVIEELDLKSPELTSLYDILSRMHYYYGNLEKAEFLKKRIENNFA